MKRRALTIPREKLEAMARADVRQHDLLVEGGFRLKQIIIRRLKKKGTCHKYIYRRPRHAGLTCQFIVELWEEA